MNAPLRFLLAPVAALALAGCGSETVPLDAGPDTPDAGPPADAGVRALCPLAENQPTCQAASECGDDIAPPPNCAWCKTRNLSLCELGQCRTPDRLMGNQPMTFSFRAPDLEADLVSYAGVVVTVETTGGNAIGCADVLAGAIDWAEPCYNIIDTRYAANAMRVGDTFLMSFTQLPSELRALFAVYAFDSEGADGAPIGVACAEADLPAVGATDGPTEVSGGEMTSLR